MQGFQKKVWFGVKMNKRLLSLLVSISLANVAFAAEQDNATVVLGDITVKGEKIEKSLKDKT